MREIWKDVVISARVFRRAPGLAAGVAVTIGLGVGTSLAIFGLLHDTLIARSPFRDPDRLVILANTGRYYYEGSVSEGLASPHVSGPDYADLEAQVRTLSAVGGAALFSGVMTGGDRPRPVWRTLVTPGLLALLGARPRLGRLLEPADFEPGATPAAVLTDSMWRRHFGSDPGVLGRTIQVDDQPFTVVGVAPDSTLRFLAQPEGVLDRVQDRQIISPLVVSMAGREAGLFKYLQQHRDAPWFPVVGRVAPGQTPQSVASEIAVIAGRLKANYPKTNARRGLQVAPLETWRTAKVRDTTVMLLAAALLVFLVASFNAAGLILSESVRHETETAVRQALGAGTARLVRFEFLRSIVLAVPGGVLALVLAGLTLFVVDRTLAGGSGSILRALFVPRVALAAVAATVLAGTIAGAGAAWSLRRRNIAETLKEGGLTASAGRRRLLATRALVALQVAAATALVLGAGLMLRSVRNIVGVPLGFDVGHSFVMQVRLPPSRYPKGENQRAFYLQALRRVRALPGVTAAGVAMTAPLTGTSMVASGIALYLPSGESVLPERLNVQTVMPGYLEALDMTLARGRWFNDGDYATSAGAAVVDQAFCNKYLAGADPLQVRIGWRTGFVPIVGVVANVRRDGPLSEPVDMLYMIETFDRPAPWSYVLVRAAGSPSEIAPAVLREVLAVDPAVATEDPQLVSELFANTFATRRRLLLLLGGAAAVVLLLTAFSLLSALGQFVAARRRDIAIRVALGARGRHVTGMLGRHVTVAVSTGLAIGAAGGLALARTLSTELFGVKPDDPVSVGGTLVAVALLAVAASVGPIWRGTHVDPTATLRAQ